MTDLAQPAKTANPGPVRSSISWTTAVGNLLTLPGPLLVALLCVLAGLLGFTTYASYGSAVANEARVSHRPSVLDVPCSFSSHQIGKPLAGCDGEQDAPPPLQWLFRALCCQSGKRVNMVS